MHRKIVAQWREGDTQPRPSAGILDVWRIDLGAPDGPAETTDQRSRAHVARDIILGRYLGIGPGAIELDRQPGGKPYLTSSALQFNLSHTRGTALLAVHASRPVGVDIEARRSIKDPLRLARRVLPVDQVERLQAVSPETRLSLFLDLWTRFEARQKTLGKGVLAPHVDPDTLSSFSFSAGEGLYACVAIADPGRAPDLRLFDFGRQ